ncbi:MAG: glycosyltransferase family 39 protein [Ruminococcus sp.]|nr:glycosyltransferase family 39 protein [Ruminococcus sp.]MCM1381245.1 glycosyltransferase family 39 protein [Muribaculaceae bacterium]MCM1479813.1 glycosyltransferase family 39 protein [Muribaculaceae bacterium]
MSKVKKYIKENYLPIIIFAVLSVVEIAVIFPIMYGDFLSYDSSYQYGLTRHTLSEIWRLLPEDYSPPFYSVALKLYCMVFGYTLTAMRSFSIFAVVGMLFVAAFPVNTLFGKKSAVYCLIITFCSFTVLNMIHEIRPTIFAMFFYMAVVAYAGVAYFTGKRYSYVCLTVFSVLAMYTHNVAMVGTFGVYVVLLLFSLIQRDWKKLRNFFISGGICGVLYLPWLTVVLSQAKHVSDYFWVPETNFFFVFNWVFKDFYDSNVSGVWKFMLSDNINLIVTAVILLIVIKHINFKKIKGAAHIKDVVNVNAEKTVYEKIFLIFLFIVASIAFMEVVSLLVSNLRTQRYYYILAMAWFIVFSALIGHLGNKFVCAFLALALSVNNIVNIAFTKNEVDNSSLPQIVSDIEQRSAGEDICFLHFHEYSLGIMSYYFPDATNYICDETFTVQRDFDVFNTNVIDIGSVDNIWDYTDKCYVFTDKWKSRDDQVFLDDELERMGDNELTEIETYTMAYMVFSKEFHLAEAVYTGDKSNNNDLEELK